MTERRDELLESRPVRGDDDDVTPLSGGVRRVARALLISLAVWWFLATPVIYQAYRTNKAMGNRPQVTAFVVHPLIRYSIMALLSVPIFALTRRFPLQRGTTMRTVAAHTLGFIAFIIFSAWLRHLSLYVFPLAGPHDFWLVLRNIVLQRFVEHTWAYGGIVVAAHAVNYYRAGREREVREAELRSQLARQQLQILKLQLHPHFLFNTLHGISSLMETDVERARMAIAHFSDLLRLALEQTERDEITVEEELGFVESYLILEKLRLGDRLTHRLDVDPAVTGAIVPTMVLQPLIENAIRHGIERRRSGGSVVVDVRPDAGALRISVVNDAPAEHSEMSGGLGLPNTRGRLLSLYGEAGSLVIRRVTPEKVEVVARVPLRIEPQHREPMRAHSHQSKALNAAFRLSEELSARP